MNEMLETIPLGGEQAAVVRWLVEAEATVAAGQPLVVLLGERAEFAVAATQAGRIGVQVAEGATVHIGGQLAKIEQTSVPRPLRASPLARRVAGEHDVPLVDLIGSGPGGRILKRDVLAYIGRGETHPVGPKHLHDREALSYRYEPQMLPPNDNQTITNNEQPTPGNRQPLTTPRVVTIMEADWSAVQRASRQLSTGTRIGVNLAACVALVVAEALREHPQFRTAWHNGELVRRQRITIGVQQGEQYAIVGDAQDLNVRGIARALTRQTQQDDITFSIRIAEQSDWAQSAQVPTVVVGAVTLRPVVQDTGPNQQIVIRPIGRLTLHYDPRIATQREADSFLRAVVMGIEGFRDVLA